MASPGWLLTEGVEMARALEGVSSKLVSLLGLSGVLLDESESWESCTVTQLITLAL